MFPLLKGAATAGLGLLLAATVPPPAAQPPQAPASRVASRASGAPDRPKATVDIAIPVARRTVRVAAGSDLQAAIDKAIGGDVLVLDAGATYRGPFRLRKKDTVGWIVIASSSMGKELPAPGHRVDKSQARLFATLTAESGTVLEAEPGAHHYRLIGLEIAPAKDTFVRDLVVLGTDISELDSLPHHLIFDRCYLHGDPAKGGRRAIALNSRHTAVVDSYLSDFKEIGADSQAIAGWNGAGPFLIANNYLEAAGENVMFGGADPTVPQLVPADIEVVRNHFSKPLSWRVTGEEAQRKSWNVKNLFELKNARRVVIEHNLFEYNWPHGQNGFAILFTPRNQDGRAPWSTVEHVTFAHNLVRHVAAGINILGHDDNFKSEHTRRISIHDNLFQDVGGQWGNGRLFQLLDGVADVTIDHNTAFQTDSIVYGGDHAPHPGFVFENNIALHNDRGIIGSGTAPGTGTLRHYFPDALVRRNVFVGANSGQYPPDNFFPASIDEVGLEPRAELRLLVKKRYGRQGTDGREVGADIAAIAKVMASVGTPPGGRPSAADVPGPAGHAPGPAPALAAIIPAIPAIAMFWISAVLLAYVYVGYALVMRVRAFVRPRPVRSRPIEPHVTIVVCAYNEAARIAARIENLLALDYPEDRIEILIGSDGSTDETVAIAERFAPAVRVHAFRQRRGKPAVINTLVAEARGSIVVFADARQRFEAGAVRALVANFADAAVGAAGGELVLVDRTKGATGQGAGFYWKYEKFIRAMESRSGSTVGATGAIYAIRRELFSPIPDGTVLDDVVIPVRIARRGYRVVFEPQARAFDEVATTTREEFTRKTRTIAGTFQLFAHEPWLWSPRRNPVWFEALSHKALRLTIPVLHASLLGATLASLDQPVSQLALIGQALFYGAAGAGYLQRHATSRFLIFSVPYAMCLQGWATVVGFFRFATGRQQVTWERATTTT